MDYVTLNDGFDDEPTANSRKRKKITHRPRGVPSATRVAAQKHTTSPEAIEASNKDNKESDSTLSGIPSSGVPSASISTTNTITDTELTGIPTAENILPDLVTNRVPDTVETVNTGEELEIADALLSLGEVRDDTINDDNVQLMPVGAPTGITDAVPVPVLLDQVKVDNDIASMLETDDFNKTKSNAPVSHPGDEGEDNSLMEAATTGEPVITSTGSSNTENRPKSVSPTQGSLKIKTHVLKKKVDSNRRYKCSVCGVTKPTIQQVNEHHLKKHKPQICTVCGRTFALALSLTRHMYDHEQRCFNCDSCDYTAHFESELKAHKIVHRKNPAFQCMVKNCGKWFHCKWELTMHVRKHDGEKYKCDECEFTTNLEKHLKEHKCKHSDDCPYLCKICNKGFHY